MGKKLTIKELIAQKEALKSRKKKTANLFVESLEGEITIESPTSDIMLTAQSEGETDAVRADRYLVYKCVKDPNLSDKELQEAYGCVEPIDIVKEIFQPGEVSKIAVEIMNLGGYGNSVTKVASDLKNS